MVEEPTNIVLVRLNEFREENRQALSEINQKIDETNQKIGSLAQTLVGVQRDVNGLRRDFNRLSDTVATLSIAMDAHTDRLDHIEKHLGIGGTPN